MENLHKKAEVIRDERGVGKNTSDRVGGLLAEIAEEVEVLKSWRGFRLCGSYDSEKEYKKYDLMEYEGASYVAVKTFKGITPVGDNIVTQCVSRQGEKGDSFTYEDFTPEQLATLKGEKGEPGKGLIILGYYGTVDLLKAAIPTPEPGDAYGVGVAAPYNIYVYDGVTSDWVDNGTMSGGGEGGGNVVLIPAEVLSLTNTSTSAEILTALGGKEAFIDIVTKIKEGVPALVRIKEDNAYANESLKTTGALVDSANNTYTLHFVGIGSSSFSVTISLTGDIATYENNEYPLVLANKNSMLTRSQLISDPSIGVIDAPASSLAVKKVNDKVERADNGAIYFNTGMMNNIIEKIKGGAAIATSAEVLAAFNMEFPEFKQAIQDIHTGKKRVRTSDIENDTQENSSDVIAMVYINPKDRTNFTLSLYYPHYMLDFRYIGIQFIGTSMYCKGAYCKFFI